MHLRFYFDSHKFLRDTTHTHMHIHAHALAPFGERGPAGDLKASRVFYRQIYYRAGKPLERE